MLCQHDTLLGSTQPPQRTLRNLYPVLTSLSSSPCQEVATHATRIHTQAATHELIFIEAETNQQEPQRQLLPADAGSAQNLVSQQLQCRQSLLTPFSLCCICHIVVQVQPASHVWFQSLQGCLPSALTGEQPQTDSVSYTLNTST